MTKKMTAEQKTLLHNISMIDFAMVEMIEYLDTHPYDKEAIEYFNHYNRIKHQLMREYAEKYYPLSVKYTDTFSKEWDWALAPMPWEGEC